MGNPRDDFEKTGLSSLVTIRVRDIQDEGFLDEFTGLAKAIFLLLPQLCVHSPHVLNKFKDEVKSFEPASMVLSSFLISVFIYIFLI
ncbi:tRNA methylation [Spatholobus suberectus]|nr:tRNA methylation [Spatholobus suberectus]